MSPSSQAVVQIDVVSIEPRKYIDQMLAKAQTPKQRAQLLLENQIKFGEFGQEVNELIAYAQEKIRQRGHPETPNRYDPHNSDEQDVQAIGPIRTSTEEDKDSTHPFHNLLGQRVASRDRDHISTTRHRSDKRTTINDAPRPDGREDSKKDTKNTERNTFPQEIDSRHPITRADQNLPQQTVPLLSTEINTLTTHGGAARPHRRRPTPPNTTTWTKKIHPILISQNAQTHRTRPKHLGHRSNKNLRSHLDWSHLTSSTVP
ncbi:hypothetical protein BDZ91DRAFT_766960 [Kalaharituber pfeilii]|nr:hypothetical protein BDZ91DRAFT_766960 [Kalaharituber pfeilii]